MIRFFGRMTLTVILIVLLLSGLVLAETVTLTTIAAAAGGGGVKSVQRGTIASFTGSTSVTLPTAILASKSVITINGGALYYTSGALYVYIPAVITAYATAGSGATMTITGFTVSYFTAWNALYFGSGGKIDWVAIEYQ